MTHTFIKTAVLSGALMALFPGAVQAQQEIALEQARYEPIQSISYVVASTLINGYFTTEAGRCLVRLMLMENKSWSQADPITASRVRLSLHPGQVAGLDSEKGPSLNFTCVEGATALLVDTGSRDRLVALERYSVQGLYALQVSYLGG